ncbi:hypothetical protein BKA63DRAFT_569731 [Paraphoma chrysanthemicola]|nr:hypothetical protein BKA63DRAFT_569731 [Paraphoma chrysanthemicola]
MVFVTFDDFKAWANDNHHKEFACLPPAVICVIEVHNETFTFENEGKVNSVSPWLYETVKGICIGELPKRAVESTAENFAIAKVYAYLDSDILHFAVNETKRDWSDIQYARLDEPYAWLSNVSSDNDRLHGIDVLLRHHLLANQHIEGIEADDNFREKFLRACQDIFKGQNIKKRVLGIKDPVCALPARKADHVAQQGDLISVSTLGLEDADETTTNIAQLKDHLKSLTEDVEMLKSASYPSRQNLKKEINNLKTRIGALEGEKKELQAEVGSFKKKGVHDDASLRDWQGKHVAAMEEADAWKQKYEKLKSVMRGAVEEAD